MMIRKIWTRVKYKYFRKWSVASCISPVLVLGLVYMVYRQMTKPHSREDQLPMYGDTPVSNRVPSVSHMKESEMLHYTTALKDTRPQECKDETFPDLDRIHSTKVSFIMHFKSEQFYLLKLTLYSLVKYTAKRLLHEVIIIDDGSQEKHIQKEAQFFLNEERFKGINIKTFRSETEDGPASSRVKAALLSTGDILIFVDKDVIFNVGWYEPIVDFLLKNPKSIAVPHSDIMLSGYKFGEVDSELVSTFTWKLSTLHYRVTASKGLSITSPVMRGDIFAINKEFYMSLDQLDEAFPLGEGSELEFSLRAWLCGGEIHKLKCSRVAVHNALTPKEISSQESLQRVLELWFDSYKDIVYKQTMHRNTLSEDELRDIHARKRRIMTTNDGTCKSFDWYLSNVANDVMVPGIDWIYLGKVKDRTGHCLKPSVSADVLNVELCNPPIYDPSMMFEYTHHDMLRTGGKCLKALQSNLLTFTECFDKDDLKMKWTFLGEGSIKNKFFEMCLEHTKDTDFNNDGKYIHKAVLAKCESIYTQSWQVIKY